MLRALGDVGAVVDLREHLEPVAQARFDRRGRMVPDVPSGFAPRDWGADLDLGALTPIPASYVSHGLRQRHGDLVWRLHHPRTPNAGFVRYWQAVLYECLAVLALAAAVLLTAGPVEAGPLLASAMQHAEKITLDPVAAPPTGCQAAARDGAADARERQGRAGWIVGGVLLPVIMPVLAHVLTPQPSAERMLAYGVDDARCYAASYSETAQRKRKTSAWIGLAAGAGLGLTLNGAL